MDMRFLAYDVGTESPCWERPSSLPDTLTSAVRGLGQETNGGACSWDGISLSHSPVVPRRRSGQRAVPLWAILPLREQQRCCLLFVLGESGVHRTFWHAGAAR